jgi:hypothetical protein
MSKRRSNHIRCMSWKPAYQEERLTYIYNTVTNRAYCLTLDDKERQEHIHRSLTEEDYGCPERSYQKYATFWSSDRVTQVIHHIVV